MTSSSAEFEPQTVQSLKRLAAVVSDNDAFVFVLCSIFLPFSPIGIMRLAAFRVVKSDEVLER
jgi:hypothetical protein